MGSIRKPCWQHSQKSGPASQVDATGSVQVHRQQLQLMKRREKSPGPDRGPETTLSSWPQIYTLITDDIDVDDGKKHET